MTPNQLALLPLLTAAAIKHALRPPTRSRQVPACCLNCGGRWLVRLSRETACGWCGSTVEVFE